MTGGEARRLLLAELEAGLPGIAASPRDSGVIKLVVRRPGPGLRESVRCAELVPGLGLAGDTWSSRRSSRTPDGSPSPDAEITLMNARVIALLAGPEERWSLAGDQFFVDLDLSEANLPPGTRLALGEAVLEITAAPHTGCKKFSDWFGPDSLRFVNSAAGRALRLRGVNARIVKGGRVSAGDAVSRIV